MYQKNKNSQYLWQDKAFRHFKINCKGYYSVNWDIVLWFFTVVVLLLLSETLSKSIDTRRTYLRYKHKPISYHEVGGMHSGASGEYLQNLYIKMFYSQRNLYLTGFCLFLSGVIIKFIHLLHKADKLQKELLIKREESSPMILQTNEEEIEKANAIIDDLRKVLQKQEGKFTCLELQSKNQNDSYMKLADDYNLLEAKLNAQKKEENKKHK